MLSLLKDTIATSPAPACYLCGTKGEFLYRNLKDRLFGAPGRWNIRQCSNRECELAWLDPMPTREDISKAYQNYYTHKCSDQQSPAGCKISRLKKAFRLAKAGYLGWRFGYPTANSSPQKFMGLLLYLFPYRRASLDQSVMGLKAIPGGRLLEVGCGNGQALAHMRSLGWQVEGVDVDPAAVEVARSRGLKVHLGSLETVDYPQNYFDAIIMSHVMEHVHDPRELLRECHRILKTAGHLVVITPNLQSLGHIVFKDAWVALDPPRHLYQYTGDSLRSLTRSTGFKIRSLSTSSSSSPWIYQASRAIALHGVYEMGSVPPTARRLKIAAFFWLEWALMRFKPSLGEELVLLGEK